MRDVLKDESIFRTFDDARYKRNGLVYYGKKMNFMIAKEAIKKIEALIKELEKLF